MVFCLIKSPRCAGVVIYPLSGVVTLILSVNAFAISNQYEDNLCSSHLISWLLGTGWILLLLHLIVCSLACVNIFQVGIILSVENIQSQIRLIKILDTFALPLLCCTILIVVVYISWVVLGAYWTWATDCRQSSRELFDYAQSMILVSIGSFIFCLCFYPVWRLVEKALQNRRVWLPLYSTDELEGAI